MIEPQYNSFDDTIKKVKQSYLTQWEQASDKYPILNKKYSFIKKKYNEYYISKFYKEVSFELDNMLNNNLSRIEIESKVMQLVKELEEHILMDNYNMLEYFTQKDYFKVTEDFIKEVRAFDNQINYNDIFQAMRNVWIMNSIQIIFNQKVCISPSIFSYSMLYPYTDNFLDDLSITMQEKIMFNKRFRKRLQGLKCKATNANEEKIYRLVNKIEAQFSRFIYPDVYNSLLAIHTAQEKSVLQQKTLSQVNITDILNITFEKGGTSVLADGYLVNGSLSYKQIEFLFGYGLILQLIDDLQDVKEDIKNNHHTPFALWSKDGDLDSKCNKLFSLLCHFFNSNSFFSSNDLNKFKNIMLESCQIMILEAISSSKELFSKQYVKNIEKYSLVKFSYYDKMKNRLTKDYNSQRVNNLVNRFIN